MKKSKQKVCSDSSSLKGTLAAVFILGFFLIATWVGVFCLYIVRL